MFLDTGYRRTSENIENMDGLIKSVKLRGEKDMVLQTIIFIVSFIIAAVIVNKVQQLYMKIMGADMMYFSMKKKLVAIILVGVLVYSLFANIFGLGS